MKSACSMHGVKSGVSNAESIDTELPTVTEHWLPRGGACLAAVKHREDCWRAWVGGPAWRRALPFSALDSQSEYELF